MDHEEYYQKICKPAFEEILTEIRDLKSRLFIDNGIESVQSRLNKHDRTIKIWCWVIGVIGAAALSGLANQIVEHFTGQ